MLLHCAVLLVLVGAVVAQSPDFPDQYYVKGVFSIPYFNISEPIEMWYDAVYNQQVISYYNGMDVTITIENTTYSIYPELGVMKCTKSVGYQGPLISLFPDLEGYTLFNATTEVNNIMVQQYQLSFHNWSASATYDMYISTTGVPIQLYLNGVDYIFDSHPDIYILDYGLYLPDYYDATAFDIPSICANAEVVDTVRSRGNIGKMFSIISEDPAKPDSVLEGEFQQFIQKYNKQYASKEEYSARFEIFKETITFINTHNADDTKTHKVAINHFADMTHEEFTSTITPKVKRPSNDGATFSHKIINNGSIPATVDWRQKGAVTPVKDQGVCGSCYAFGSIGSLEGAYQIATGTLISMSEQQIVDCAWNDALQVQGCNGGYASVVMQWMINNGGLATEASYPYLMQDGYCRANDHSSGVRVKAYVNVTQGEDDLLSAVAIGPVAVAIDASHPEFRYYTSGVYYQANCGNTLDDLDHEVLAIGYGTYNGQDYWLVKNSWSTHWGNEGYVMMSRNKDNNCGIATQPNYPIVAA
jgi:C1A family cysteine protease